MTIGGIGLQMMNMIRKQPSEVTNYKKPSHRLVKRGRTPRKSQLSEWLEAEKVHSVLAFKGTSLLRFQSKITPRVIGTGDKTMIRSYKKKKKKKKQLKSATSFSAISILLRVVSVFLCALSRVSRSLPRWICRHQSVTSQTTPEALGSAYRSHRKYMIFVSVIDWLKKKRRRRKKKIFILYCLSQCSELSSILEKGWSAG